jgi:hypothetical protein
VTRPALQRIGLVAAILAVAALAGWWISREAPPEPAPPSRAQPSPSGPVVPRRPGNVPPLQKAGAENAPAPAQVSDIFAVHTWEPPPPPMPAPEAVAPPPPQAPPLPFRFLGRIVEPGQAPVFLLVDGDRVRPVKVGQRIGDAYRLEKFEGGQLYFRYRPMNVVQSLPVGGPQ